MMIEMGGHYYDKSANGYGHIKVVCRGNYYEDGTSMIAFVGVLDNGCASDILFMDEKIFRKIFMT